MSRHVVQFLLSLRQVTRLGRHRRPYFPPDALASQPPTQAAPGRRRSRLKTGWACLPGGVPRRPAIAGAGGFQRGLRPLCRNAYDVFWPRRKFSKPKPRPKNKGPPGNRGTVNDCLLCEKEMLCFCLTPQISHLLCRPRAEPCYQIVNRVFFISYFFTI